MNYITITEEEPTDNNSLAMIPFFDDIVVTIEVLEVRSCKATQGQTRSRVAL